MSVNDEERPSADDAEYCGVCRHCVDVRGMDHIVCLAYLAVRQPTDGGCVEFERQRRRAIALAKS